jgi:hypothetical protein
LQYRKATKPRTGSERRRELFGQLQGSHGRMSPG